MKNDTSDFAVGGVLVQLDEGFIQQVVAFLSKKLTGAAIRWSVIEKECFAIFYCVSKLSYYLLGKEFKVLTDHNNLVWMQSSNVPKIVRMRISLQQYKFSVSHIAGSKNDFADWLSREYVDPTLTMLASLSGVEDSQTGVEPEGLVNNGSPSSLIDLVHNARMGHHGVRRTWKLLNKHLPGHGISVQRIREYIDECIWCQKLRADMNDSLVPPVRSVDPAHPRVYCGYDTLYISPADDEGYQYLHVFKLIPSRLVGLYPAKDLSSDSLAEAMFKFFTTYGITEVIMTDPGSNINSSVVKTLLSWFGVRLRMSVVGRHESNYVERTNKEVLRFLLALVHTERLLKIWSKPHVISIIQFILNDEVNRETGLSPFHYVFGSEDVRFLVLPSDDLRSSSKSFLDTLNTHLKVVRGGLNNYQVGDLVLRKVEKMVDRASKLTPTFLGPYEVVQVYKADIQCRHLVTGAISTFHMSKLKPCFSEREEAYAAAMVDYNQYQVKRIRSYRGDPDLRTSMSFEVEFEDGSMEWLPFSKDLFDTVQFEDFVTKHRQLLPLKYKLEVWKRIQRESFRQVEGVSPGEVCFVDSVV